MTHKNCAEMLKLEQRVRCEEGNCTKSSYVMMVGVKHGELSMFAYSLLILLTYIRYEVKLRNMRVHVN